MNAKEVDSGIFEVDSGKNKIYINRSTGRAGWSYGEVADSKEPEFPTKPRISQYILQLTHSCNLSCRHCYNEFYSHKKKKCMDIETFREIIDKTTDYAERNRISDFIIVFHGGESSLCLETLEFACRYLREQPVSYSFSLQTNGLLLHKLLPLIKRYGLGISVSIDGKEEMHNGIRVFSSGEGSFARVFQNIKLLRKNGIHPHPLMTVSKYNAERIDEAVEFIAREVSPEIGDNLVFKRPELSPTAEQMKVFSERLISAAVRLYLAAGKPVLVRSLAVALKHFFTEHRYACSRSPCAAAITSLVVDPEGYAYPCDTSMKESYRLGNLMDAELEKLVRKQPAKEFRNRDYRRIHPCRECLFGSVCQGGCPSRVLEEKGTLESNPNECSLYRIFYWKILENLANMRIPREYIRFVIANSRW